MSKIIPFPKKKKDSSDERWIVLVDTPIEYEAYFICGLLETKGIPYRLQCLKHIPHPVSSGQLGSYLILVPKIWLDFAKKLINNAKS